MSGENEKNLEELPTPQELEALPTPEELEELPTPEDIEKSEDAGYFTPSGANIRKVPSVLEVAGDKVENLDKYVEGVREGTSKKTLNTLSKLPYGRLPYEDLEYVSKNLQDFKDVKSNPSKLADDFTKFGKEVEDVGYTATKNVGDILEKEGKTLESKDIIKAVGEEVADLPDPDKAKLDKIDKAEKGLIEANKKIERAEKFYDRKITEANKELEELQDRLDEYRQKRFDREDSQKLRDAEHKLVNEQIAELKEQKKALTAKRFKLKKTGASGEALLDINRKLELNKEAIDDLSTKKTALTDNLKEQVNLLKEESKADSEVIKKLEARKKEIQRELKNVTKPEKKKELNRLMDLQKKAKELVKSESIDDLGLSDEVGSYFETFKNRVKRKEVFTGDDLAAEMKRLNRQYKNKGAPEVRRAFKSMLDNLSPLVGQSGKKAARAIEDYEMLLKYLDLDEVVEFTEQGKGTDLVHAGSEKFNKKLAEILLQEGDATQKNKLIELIKRYEGSEDILKRAELTKIAKAADVTISPVDAAAAFKFFNPSSWKRLLEGTSTKAQELGARGVGAASELLGKDTVKAIGEGVDKVAKGTGKALKTGAKVAGKVAPVAGLAFDAMDAEELGIVDEYGELGRGAYVAGEALNPLPVSSGDIYKATRYAEKHSPEAAIATQAVKKMVPVVGDIYKFFKDLDEKKQVKEITKLSEDRENVGQLIGEMKQVDEDFANRIQNIQDTSENDTEFKRRISLLSSDPAYRELVRRRMRRIGNEQSDRDEN